MVPENFNVLIPKAKIDAAIDTLATQLNQDYSGKRLILVGVLKGAFIFMADLMRKLHMPTEVDFVKLESYGSGTESSGTVKLLKDIDTNINGHHVLIVEEIIDSGRTLHFLYKRLQAAKPESLKICALLDKKERRVADIEADYVGMDVENKFLVGYGLDYDQAYRNLPDIYYIEEAPSP
jgi:hypoxanthine phosphoribosyltransferase